MTTYATAHDPRAPHDERNDALGQLQQTYLPTPSDLIPRADLAPVIDFIADQYAQQDAAILRKAQAIDFMGRPRAKTGMQSVRLDPLQALAFGDYHERPSVLNTDALRSMVEQTPILNAVLLTRIRQVQRFCQPQDGGRGPGFMIAHVDPQHDITPPEQRAREALTRFLTHSGWESRPRQRARLRRDPFSTLIAKATRESLTYDALAIETETQRGTGLLDGCYALDGSTIRLCPETGYRGDPDVFAVQVVTGQVVTTYTHDDLIYTPRNPRADVRLGGYGLGETELLVRVVTGFLNAMTHNSKGFDDNSFPRGFLSLFGTIDTSQQEAFKRHWHSMVHGPNNHWRMPVLFSQDPTGKAEFTRIDVAADEMHFAKWMTFLTSLICAIYGMSPAEINFDSFTGGNTSALAGSDTAQKLAASKDSGLRPLLSYLEGVCSDDLVGRFSDHYCFRWTGLDEDDAAQRLEIRKLVLTVNELRAEEGYAALPGPLGDAPINPSLIGPWMQIATGGGQTDDTSGADAREQDGATASADSSQPGGPDAGDQGDQKAAAAAATEDAPTAGRRGRMGADGAGRGDGAEDAGGRLAKADPYHDDDGRFARSPQVHYEKRQLHELYDFTLKHPLAAPDAMLVRLQASDLVAQLDKGPAVEASDGSIKVTGKQLSRQPGGTARGYGLVKFIWKHGERAGETAGYHVTRGDVLALPEVIRSTPTAIVSDATGHPVHWEWRRTRFDGKTAVYGASRFTSSDDRNHLVTLYIEQPGRVQKSGSNLGEGLFTPMPRIPACDLSIVQQAVEPLTIYYCPAQTEVKDAMEKALHAVDPQVWTIAT